ncbi:MAG: endopeptidase La [Armatimonadota bacterium]|jgi:ATP-dependent Lon protease
MPDENDQPIERGENGDAELPKALPALPLRRNVVYPQMIFPLEAVAGPEATLIDAALAGRGIIALVATKNPDAEISAPTDLYTIGTATKIFRMMKMPDGSRRVLCQGISRIEITRWAQTEPFLIGRVRAIAEAEEKEGDEQLAAYRQGLLRIFNNIVDESPALPDEVKVHALNVESSGSLADLVAANLNLELPERQEILELIDPLARLQRVTEFASRELERLKIGSRIEEEAQEEMTKAQRDYFLRQQLRAIQKELGEAEGPEAEVEELRERVEEAKMPEAAHAAAMRELDRLARISTASAEYTTARTYVDWLLDVPWSLSSEDSIDLRAAQRVLDDDHYDLDKVKDRILEYLAVRKLKDDMKGPILCFVGPPGTGKTSLGQSIAHAMGRNFVRISLGGVRDEAEIRGHRRTYVGALPGRIVQGIKNAGTNNPIFMLDEIDKLGADFRGDPSAALLEVLDPEQNHAFSDHYIDVPFDLSHVIFICTANVLDTVPPALQDRMETLTLPGYTDAEKIQIARQFLIPRQLDAHGLKRRQLRLSDAALKRIIGGYTREAGLRNLEREIGTVCRKAAKAVATGRRKPASVTVRNIEDYLGAPRFFSETALRRGQVGVVCALAYTPAGGDILFVEATRMPGSMRVQVTGHIGDVMKESAEAALSFVRSNAKRLGIDPNFFENTDIHIHVPAGGTPKDGPSAGVSMATALVSLLTSTPARSDTAMTGEITLRGQVLPIGGVKQKVLAAHRARIKRIILPRRNENDLEDIPKELTEGLEFIFVERLHEVIDAALEKEAARRRRAAKPA